MKQLQGIVTRVNDERTAKVEVARRWKHPVYKKFVKRTKNYLAHVPAEITVAVGDEVTLTSCPPVSKRKNFMITEKKEA